MSAKDIFILSPYVLLLFLTIGFKSFVECANGIWNRSIFRLFGHVFCGYIVIDFSRCNNYF